MRPQFERYLTGVAIIIVVLAFATGCREPEVTVATPLPPSETVETQAPPPTPEVEAQAPSPTAELETVEASPTVAAEPEDLATPTPTATPEPELEGVLIHDTFVDTGSGWVPSQEYDNYYIGYHEPEWYHVEVQELNDYASVVLEGQIFDDVTAETEAFVEETLSAPDGDFRYGLVMRRSGRQFYAFTISSRTQRWAVLKSSPTSLVELQVGDLETIGATGKDTLRVDASGPTFTFHINGQRVAQVEDGDYASGELGFFVQTFDAPRTHIHYDSLIVRQVQVKDLMFDDNFQDLGSGWEQQEFDNYYLGYHEPEWYHVEVQAQHDSAMVFIPQQTFNSVTAETEAFVEETLSAPEGDFQYGLALRRTGRQFYAFTISPRTGAWRVLKSSPTTLEVLDEGSIETIQDAEADTLRVDANGSWFTFHVNGQSVSNVYDADYGSGELGFYVETFDSPKVHIHFDSLTVREVDAPPLLCTVTASLNLRTGPGVAYGPPIAALPAGTQLEPLARSAYLPWIQVRVQGSGQVGWVYADLPYASCNFALADLPPG